VDALESSDAKVVQEYLIEVICAGDEEKFNKVKAARISNMKAVIKEFDIWEPYSKPSIGQQKLIRSMTPHLTSKDQDTHLSDALDCVHLSSYRHQLITKRREAEAQHPGISTLNPHALISAKGLITIRYNGQQHAHTAEIATHGPRRSQIRNGRC
jgi:hypothetical protein